MSKNRFFIKSGLLCVLVATVLAVVFYFRYSGHNGRYLLLNHLSNSICFNSNIQNFLQESQLNKIDFVVIGSSMSMNNISAKMMADSFKCHVYNFSSWGFRSDKIIGFLNSIVIPNCKEIVLAFNNNDFGINKAATFDFGKMRAYINGNSVERCLSFINTFNFREFDHAFITRRASLDRNNEYMTLGFDRYGSVLLDSANFKIDSFRYANYFDTVGFDIFLKNVQTLQKCLNEKKIRLVLVYEPYRHDLLNTERSAQNSYVAQRLRGALPFNFVDMHLLDIPAPFYADAAHLFRRGAEFLTKTIIDSLKR